MVPASPRSVVTPKVEPRRAEETMLSASARVVEAGVNLLVDRIDLARAEVRDAVATSASRGIWIWSAAMAFFTAWALAMAAIVSALVAVGAPPSASIAAGALVSASTGAGLLLLSRRKSAGVA